MLIVLAPLVAVGTVLQSGGCDAPVSVQTVGVGTAGATGVPELRNEGAPVVQTPFSLRVSGAPASSGLLAFGVVEAPLFVPLLGGVFHPSPPFLTEAFALDDDGQASGLLGGIQLDPAFCGLTVIAQAGVFDAAAQGGVALTNALRFRVGVVRGYLFSGARVSTVSSTTPKQLVAVDANQDGEQDVLVTEGISGIVSILVGAGEGKLASAQTVDNTLNEAHGVDAGDWDGDGVPDLAVTDRSQSRVFVYLGAGDGTFARIEDHYAGLEPVDVASGDLSGDGARELLVVSQGMDDLFVFDGQGDGSFVSGGTIAVGDQPHTALIGDWNADGMLDAAVTNSSDHNLSVFLNVGGGQLAGGGTYLAGNFPAAAVACDLDLNGFTDVAVAGTTTGFKNVTVQLGQGDGSFLTLPSLDLSGSANGLACLDLDGDSDPDLVFPDANTGLLVALYGNGDGTLTEGERLFAANGLRLPIAVDLEGDAVLDLVAASGSDGEVVVVPRRDPGGGLPGGVGELPADADAEGLDLADFNNDGEFDACVAYASPMPRLVVLRGDGTGSMVQASSLIPIGQPRDIAAGDLDSDGNPDCCIPVANGFVEVHLGNGFFGFSEVTSPQVGQEPVRAKLGDLNLDGHLDLVVANQNSDDAAVLIGTGDGSLLNRGFLATGQGPNDVVISEFDLDGVPDIAVANLSSQSISAFVGLGAGGFLLFEEHSMVQQVKQVEASDVDDDGSVDLVGVMFGSGQVLLGAGDGTFADGPPVDFGGGEPMGVVLVDVDGDDREDLLVARKPHELLVMGGMAAGTFVELDTFNVGRFASDNLLATADLNHDGMPDAVMARTAFKAVQTFLNLALHP